MTHTHDMVPSAIRREAMTHSRYDTAASAVEASTCHSWKMTVDRAAAFPPVHDVGGSHTPQVFVRAAAGSRLIDLDDNAFIDLCMGFGTVLLGHSHPAVERSILQQIQRGWQFGLRHDGQLALGRLIQEAGPSNQRVQFCATESDATALAMRLARAVTGRNEIVVFDGASHGQHDYALIASHPGKPGQKIHLGHGIPGEIDDLVTPLVWGSEDALSYIASAGPSLAGVLVEPVMSACPLAHDGRWLRALEAACRKSGALFMLDESTVGFRLAYGGGQDIFGLSPDLVTYGANIASGLPIGVVTGQADVMALLTPRPGRAAVFSGGVHNGSPLAVAAATATLTELKSQGGTFYADLAQKAERFAAQVNNFATATGIPLQLLQNGSMLRLLFQSKKVRKPDDISIASVRAADAFFTHLLDRRILVHGSQRMFLSAAHDEDDIDLLVDGFLHAARSAAADGFFESEDGA